MDLDAARGRKPGPQYVAVNGVAKREPFRDDLAQVPILRGQCSDIDRLSHGSLELFPVEGLREIVEGADLHGFDR